MAESPAPTGAGALLRHHRVRAGLDQDELAARAGVSVRALRDIEQGRVRRPRESSVRRLLAALPAAADVRAALLTALTGLPAQRRGGGRAVVEVLGPLTVRRGEDTVELDQALPRTLLGLLALQPGTPVPVSAAIDALWPEDPPATSRNLIQVYVGRLRRLLEPDRSPGTPGRAIRLGPAGYRLDPTVVDTDVARFADLVARAGPRGAEPAEPLLLAALRCWRGPVLADAEPRLRDHPAAVELARHRTEAALAYADLALAAGHAAAAVAQLRAPATADPLHEGLHARLIRALAAGGEQGAALRAFEALRDRLLDQLGVTPGEEVAAAHLAVLRGTRTTAGTRTGGTLTTTGAAEARRPPVPTPPPPTPPSPAQTGPAQLPAAAFGFTGRTDALLGLDGLLERRATIGLITGAGGVGKTALAVHWAHRIRRRFPDGQLYVNLHGYAPTPPVRPVAALARFLHALGVAPDRVPVEVDEAAALFRSLVADREMLVLLDNAHDAAHIRPLLPGAAGGLVVVTSRDALGGLVAIEGAVRVQLLALTPAESRELLGGLLEATGPVVDELAALCGHLPLALRVAAANLTDPAAPDLDTYVAGLRDGNPLAALAVDGDPQAAVRGTFELSYAARRPAERVVFRRLGLLPGPDVTADAAAALADVPADAAADALRRLADAHLVEEHTGGRFGLHDLLRAYAAERAEADDFPAERRAAVLRLYGHYGRTADAAAGLLYPQILRLPRNAAGPGTAFGGEPARAVTWLDSERPNLVAAVTRAADEGPYEVAWSLADTLRGHFFMRMPTVDWLTVAGAGLAAAQADRQPAAEAAARLSLAGLLGFTGRHREAIEHYRAALLAGERADWPAAQATVLGNLGAVHADQGRLGDALEHLQRALAINTRTGWEAGQEVNLGNLGVVCTELGRLGDALDHLRRAITLNRRLEHRGAVANTLGALGEVHHLLGRPERAMEHLTEALDLLREVGNRGAEGDAVRIVAAVHRDLGDLDRALTLATEALDLAGHTGHRRLEADARTTLGTVLLARGDTTGAVEQHHLVLAITEPAGYRYSQCQTLIGLAAATRDRDPADRAVALAVAAGFRVLEGRARTELAATLLAAGDRDAGMEAAAQALKIHEETGHLPGARRTSSLLEG